MPYLGITRPDLCSICAADSHADHTGAACSLLSADSRPLAGDDSLAPPACRGDHPSGTGGACLVTGHSGQQPGAGR
jgi:hypothetical protein